MDERLKSTKLNGHNGDFVCDNSNSNNNDDVDGSSTHVSAEEMDERRQQKIAYEYLCHLEEAKK